MRLTPEQRAAAIRDPGYHRYLMFGAADRRLEKTLGRPLEYHERQAHLPWPQRQIVKRVERAIYERGGTIAIRTARQSGKNETSAFLQCRGLSIFSRRPSSIWVRIAPTHKPQIVTSKKRLEKFTKADPLLAYEPRHTESYIREYGEAQINFLSGSKTANVVGDTASICLDVDEAHKIDRGKFFEDLAPFTASTNAPTIMWGVAAAKLDLLYEHVEKLRGTDRLLEYPASVWCELSPAYAAHYSDRVAMLGADHPIIRTQYDLIDVDSIGGFLNASQRESIFRGDHPRLTGPRAGMFYGLIVDIGGEAEEAAEDEEIRLEAPGRDSTMAWVIEWDPAEEFALYPSLRIVDGHWWTGREHPKATAELERIARQWHIEKGVVDGRGVGEATAMALSKSIPCIETYKASSSDVSLDCYDLLARVNAGTVRMWRADPQMDHEHRELGAQSRHTKYEIHGHDLMRLRKPTGLGSTGLHIDGIKALTYIRRLMVPDPDAGLRDYYRQLRASRA